MKKSARGVMENPAKGIKWDLSDLYQGIDDPKIKKDLRKSLRQAKKFNRQYKGKLATIGPTALLTALKKLEVIYTLVWNPIIYSMLIFSDNSQNPAYGAFRQEMGEWETKIDKFLLFFDLEWTALDEKKVTKLLASKEIAPYRYYLSKLRHSKPHILTESEEKIIEEKDNTGSQAFKRLFTEVIGRMSTQVQLDGERKKLTFVQTLPLLNDPNRKNRRIGARAITKTLKANEHILTFIFNILLQDKRIMDKLRSYPHPMAARNLSNETDDKSVKILMKTCERKKNQEMVARFYRLKRKLLGLKTLKDYDRYAPLFPDEGKITWQTCKKIVLDAYQDFSPEMAEIIALAFKKNWVDAEMRPGKRGGACCMGCTSDLHPYVLCNYSGSPNSVKTVAHEMGHFVHNWMALDQGIFQSDTPLTTAETASVFGETLTFQKLLRDEKDPKKRLALLFNNLENSFATVFRQIAMTRFEQMAHLAIKKEEKKLTNEQLNQLWLKANQPMFGDSVELTKDYSWWWMYIPHFIRSPFYCYAYAFGKLLVLPLYQCYLEEGKSFVPKYLELLKAGGSEKPEELLKQTVGVDITKPDFWQKGLDMLAGMVDEAEKLARSLKLVK